MEVRCRHGRRIPDDVGGECMYCAEDDVKDDRIAILERENARLRDMVGVCSKHNSLNVVLDAFCEECDKEYSAKRAAREG